MNVQTEEYFGVVHFESKVYFSFPISSLEFLEQRAYIYLILLHFYCALQILSIFTAATLH